MLAALLIAAAQAATPFGGVEWRPLSRADLVWVDEGRLSGVAVGEFDGTARPGLQAYGGAWLSERVGLSASLGVARIQNTTEVNEVITHHHWGVFRPGIDLRWSLTQRAAHRPFPWLLAGVHGDIPTARDVSSGYTAEEQQAADDLAFVERARLGGLGARAGIGAEYEVLPGLGIGAQWALEWHRGTWRADDLSQVSQWLAANASLLMTFRWPNSPEEDS